MISKMLNRVHEPTGNETTTVRGKIMSATRGLLGPNTNWRSPMISNMHNHVHEPTGKRKDNSP